jgi:hypothetical protein
MKLTLCLIALLGLTGCVTASGAGTFKTFVRHELTGPQRQLVMSAVSAVLKDPGSAQFGDMRAGITSKNFIVVCGVVNSRNSFGGYVGNKPYALSLTPDGTKISSRAMLDSDPVDRILVQSMCKNVNEAT